jgi:hypothetical protein
MSSTGTYLPSSSGIKIAFLLFVLLGLTATALIFSFEKSIKLQFRAKLDEQTNVPHSTKIADELAYEPHSNTTITYDPTYESIPDYSDTPERIALISTTMDTTFGFFTPLTSFLWKRMGWNVVVIAIGSSDSWEQSFIGRLLRDAILKSSAKIVYFPHHPLLFNNYEAGSIAQVSRILAGGLSDEVAPPGSYILASDADIWTFKPSYFRQIDFSKICIAHANFYYKNETTNFHNATRFPMTYIGAIKEDWKTIMKLDRVNETSIIQEFHENIVKSGLFLILSYPRP